MKRAEYLQRIEQIKPWDIEAFVKIFYEVIANKANLDIDSRDMLTALLAEKVLQAGPILRARLEQDRSHLHSPRPVPARMNE